MTIIMSFNNPYDFLRRRRTIRTMRTVMAQRNAQNQRLMPKEAEDAVTGGGRGPGKEDGDCEESEGETGAVG